MPPVERKLSAGGGQVLLHKPPGNTGTKAWIPLKTQNLRYSKHKVRETLGAPNLSSSCTKPGNTGTKAWAPLKTLLKTFGA